MQEELELENETENETEEIEVVTEDQSKETTETPAEPETEPEAKAEDSDGPVKKADDDEDEIENYSESVQRRIRKLTAKYREEERQRQAAIDYAEAVKKQNDELQQQLQTREESYVGEFGSRVQHEEEAAKEAYRRAHEEGDVDGLVDAQQRISKIVRYRLIKFLILLVGDFCSRSSPKCFSCVDDFKLGLFIIWYS